MNESEFAYKIKHQLDHGLGAVEPRTAARLHAAREKALSRHTAVSSHLGLVGGGGATHDLWLPRLRGALAALAIAVGVIGWNYWTELERAAEFEEVDTALLSDDLPINAYLDRGFDAWIQRSAQE